MFRRHEDPRRVIDPHDAVARRMQNQQRPVQLADRLAQLFRRHILDEIAPDPERTPAQIDLGHPVARDRLQRIAEIMGHMLGVERRADRHHRFHACDPARRAQHRRPAQRMTDQDLRAHALIPEPGRSRLQIAHIRRKRRVLELAPRMAQSGEIEPQNRDSHGRQPRRDPPRRRDVLRAGKAMGKQRRRQMRPLRAVQPGGKLMSGMAGKGDTVGGHRGRVLAV